MAFSEAPLALSGNVRQRLVAYLGQAVVEAMQVGDLEAARIANQAIARLLGTLDAEHEHAEVIDLARERGER